MTYFDGLPPAALRPLKNSEEEAALTSKSKPAPKAGVKKPAKISTPAAKSSPGSSVPGTPGAGGSGGIPSFEDALNADPESFSASNLDDALSLLSLVNEKQDKASLGSKAAQTLDVSLGSLSFPGRSSPSKLLTAFPFPLPYFRPTPKEGTKQLSQHTKSANSPYCAKSTPV
ncbi:hypothetical protein P389DRAFT_4599 [Cystobasidium minutum MCA 4210]|uniref:uncharacterized protein n=1 Tax=Cystobasidium minutum MCA 4210 TaxID=1397322 RepID=UPI0034CF564B|eukprot:jgi/Rhomi1/4599/CE4598_466